VAGARAVPRAPSGPHALPPPGVRTTGRWVVSRAVPRALAGPSGRVTSSDYGVGSCGLGVRKRLFTSPGGHKYTTAFFSDPHPRPLQADGACERWAGGSTDLGGPGDGTGLGQMWNGGAGVLTVGWGDGSGGPGCSAAGRGCLGRWAGWAGGDGGWGVPCGAGWLPLWGCVRGGLSGVPVARDWRCGGVCDCGEWCQAGMRGPPGGEAGRGTVRPATVRRGPTFQSPSAPVHPPATAPISPAHRRAPSARRPEGWGSEKLSCM